LEVTRQLATLATQAAEDRKAENVLLLDLKSLTLVADYFVIASGDSSRQVRAIAEHIDETLSKAGLRLLHREGLDHAKWVLLDFGGIVCHIFNRVDRDFYGLERFWGDAPRIGSPGSGKESRSEAAMAVDGATRRASAKPPKSAKPAKPARRPPGGGIGPRTNAPPGKRSGARPGRKPGGRKRSP